MSGRAVITGGTGFIGAAVVSRMLQLGWKVTILTRPESNLERLASLSGLEVIGYSGVNDAAITQRLRDRRPDVFIHCAWRGVAGDDRDEKFQVLDNLTMSLTAVEWAAAAGCRQWIGIGSQAEYGNLNRRIDETAHPRPTTMYGKAKLAAGIATLALCEAHGMRGVWFRVFSTYGPSDSPRWFIPYVIREFLAGRRPRLTACEQRWDYLFIRDAAEAMATAAEQSAHGVFNLGSGHTRALREYVQVIAQELGTTIVPDYGAKPYRPDQVMHLEADTTRFSTATGWAPKTSFETGIRETIAFERRRSGVFG